jgi:hypothetical protein
MEHRRGQRLPISVPVGIHSQQLSLGNFTVNNISTGGMSIVDAGRQLAKGDFIQLQFYGNHQRFNPRYTKAIVVYKNKDTAGLMWVEESTDLKNLVQIIVKAAA